MQFKEFLLSGLLMVYQIKQSSMRQPRLYPYGRIPLLLLLSFVDFFQLHLFLETEQ